MIVQQVVIIIIIIDDKRKIPIYEKIVAPITTSCAPFFYMTHLRSHKFYIDHLGMLMM